MNKANLNLALAKCWIQCKVLLYKYSIGILTGKQKEIRKSKAEAGAQKTSVENHIYNEITSAAFSVHYPQYEAEADYIKRIGKIVNFPYPFIEKYQQEDVEVYYDFKKQMFYVIHNGRRLYWSSDYKSVQAVKRSYNQLRIEADAKSPHSYFNNNFVVENDSIFLDVGGGRRHYFLKCS